MSTLGVAFDAFRAPGWRRINTIVCVIEDGAGVEIRGVTDRDREHPRHSWPLPPVDSRTMATRYSHIGEGVWLATSAREGPSRRRADRVGEGPGTAGGLRFSVARK
jgi:hypothetical protein